MTKDQNEKPKWSWHSDWFCAPLALGEQTRSGRTIHEIIIEKNSMVWIVFVCGEAIRNMLIQMSQ